MIKFKNGKYIGGNPEKIVSYDYDNGITEDWWDGMIDYDCWILEIPTNKNEIEFYNAFENEISFIPRTTDYNDPDYNRFWNSDETIVFGCFEDGLKYISHYQGSSENEVKRLLKELLSNQLYDETYKQFANLENFKNEIDVDFLNELEEFVKSKKLKLNSILASMKLFILNRYKLKIEEQRLSCQN